MKILDAKYEKADLSKIVEENCSHLTRAKCNTLLSLLTEFEELFDGTLGDWKTNPVTLRLKPGSIPYHGKPYPVPHVHKDTLRKEVDRLEQLGVLKWEDDSEHAYPTFIMPKPNGTVRFLTDFRKLNKMLVRKP